MDRGILILAFGDKPDVIDEAENDVKIFSQHTNNVKFEKCNTITHVINLIKQNQPEILHLLSKFDSNGKISDNYGNSLNLGEIMKVAENAGVNIFISASENNFEYLKNESINSKSMIFLTILQRNRYYESFLNGLVSGITATGNFAATYVKLAPQYENGQRGLPLPGSIAVCPGKNGKNIVLWSNAQ